MLNYGYHLARAEGKAARILYRAMLPLIVRRDTARVARLSLEVFTYAGEENLPELVASIRSFLTYVGRPNRLTIVSDGTLSHQSADLLRNLDSVITISGCAEWVPANLPTKIYPYLTTHPTGKQLALIMSLPVEAPTLYIDSDVLFFPAARDIAQVATTKGIPALYLTDCRLSADERLLRDKEKTSAPVNTGVLFLFQRLDWTLALRRFLELEESPAFFTNQTMTHLTMHVNGAASLNPARYVLQLDDQFAYPDRYMNRDLVLRHYVGPVRHKFWTTMARRVFS